MDQTTCILGTEEAGVGADDDSLACGDRSLNIGWKLRFTEPGEKGLSTPLTDGGRVFASTFIPGDATPCSGQQGRGLLHVVQLANATAVVHQQRQYEIGPDIPSAAELLGDIIFVPGGGIDLYDLDGDGVRDIAKLLPSQARESYRIYWREPGMDPL